MRWSALVAWIALAGACEEPPSATPSVEARPAPAIAPARPMHPYLAAYRAEIMPVLRPAQAARLEAIDASPTESHDARELALVATDRVVRGALPLLLEAAALRREANALRELAAIEDAAGARRAQRLFPRIRRQAERGERAIEEPPFPGRRALTAVQLAEALFAPLVETAPVAEQAWTSHARSAGAVFVLLFEGFRSPDEMALVEPMAVDLFRDMVDPEMEEAPVPVAGGADKVWTYRNRQGRLVFVGGRSLVPPEHRDAARPLDLSHVSLNEELGSEWNATIAREHRRLAAGRFCAAAVEASREDALSLAWREHGHLIGIGGAILVLLLLSPWIARHVGGARWLRTLIFVIPMLVMLGLLAHVAVRTRDAIADTRETADLCDATRPADARTRLGIVHRLIARIREAETRRLEAIDGQVEAAREQPAGRP